MTYLDEDGPHTDPAIDAAEVSGLTIKDGIASFGACGKKLNDQQIMSAMPALGAPEIAQQ